MVMTISDAVFGASESEAGETVMQPQLVRIFATVTGRSVRLWMDTLHKKLSPAFRSPKSSFDGSATTSG